MRRLWSWLTRDWLNRVLALILAVIVFWVVDGKISQTATLPFAVRFGQVDPGASQNTLFIALPRGWAGELEPTPEVTDGRLEVTFRGPRRLVEELRSRRPLLAAYSLRGRHPPGRGHELVVDVPEEAVRFLGVDRSQVRITLPDLRVRLLQLNTFSVDVAVAAEGFLPPSGYRLGRPEPERRTVEVTCPYKYFTFTTLRFRPRREARRRLTPADNRRVFRAVRPADMPPGLPFAVNPTEMEVTLPLVPIQETLDLEVPVVLLLPADATLRPPHVRVQKERETFTFTGPPRLLQRLKELQNTRAETKAVVDLTGLTAEEWKALREGGKGFRPFFLFPREVGQEAVRCPQPKHIWVEVAQEGTD